jgi:hypothetical protein
MGLPAYLMESGQTFFADLQHPVTAIKLAKAQCVVAPARVHLL